MTIRDSLAQVQARIAGLREKALAGNVYSYCRDAGHVERACYEFLEEHGPELMKRLDRHGAGDAEAWRSIESAPRDGRTVILGSLGVKSYTGRWHDVTWVDERGLSRGPSHWRPLPAPPTDDAARAGERG